jgi:hypothetical protein
MCSLTLFSRLSAAFWALSTASLLSTLGSAVDGGYVRSSLMAVVAAAQVTFHFRNSSEKYVRKASCCLRPGGAIDQEVEVGCWVLENKVGGGSRH